MNGYMAFDTEFTEVAICTASFAYQRKKIEQLREKGLPPEEFQREFDKIVEKACICHDLGDGALAKYGLSYPKQEPVPAVCPGPNIIYFTKICSLKEMVDHIYGRVNVIDPAMRRPHVFINELRIYIEHLKRLLAKSCQDATNKEMEYFREFKKNLLSGVEYYRELAGSLREESEAAREKFVSDLFALKAQLEKIEIRLLPAPAPAL
jgi:hypothetical protein